MLRRSLLALAPALVVARPALARRFRFGGGSSGPPGRFNSIDLGTAFKYNSHYSDATPKYVMSDVWASTWASDNNTYAVNDDSLGWNGSTPTSNEEISWLDLTNDWSTFSAATIPTTLTGGSVNKMTQWGTITQVSTTDNHFYKAMGIIAINGTLYATAARQTAPWQANVLTCTGNQCLQTSQNMQIIKSNSNPLGATWTPTPTATAEPYTTNGTGPGGGPMFSGIENSTLWFVQYDTKDYAAHAVDIDNSNTYVYAVSTDGFWNNGNVMILGRCKITDMPALDATKWSYYKGSVTAGDNSGMLDPNWGTWAQAVPLLSQTLKIGTNGIQWLPAFGCYIFINWWYPSVANNVRPGFLDESTIQWDVYQSTRLWGPWTFVKSQIWNSEPGKGLYNPNIIPRSVTKDGGRTVVITSAGMSTNQNPNGGDYTLTANVATIS